MLATDDIIFRWVQSHRLFWSESLLLWLFCSGHVVLMLFGGRLHVQRLEAAASARFCAKHWPTNRLYMIGAIAPSSPRPSSLCRRSSQQRILTFSVYSISFGTKFHHRVVHGVTHILRVGLNRLVHHQCEKRMHHFRRSQHCRLTRVVVDRCNFDCRSALSICCQHPAFA